MRRLIEWLGIEPSLKGLSYGAIAAVCLSVVTASVAGRLGTPFSVAEIGQHKIGQAGMMAAGAGNGAAGSAARIAVATADAGKAQAGDAQKDSSGDAANVAGAGDQPLIAMARILPQARPMDSYYSKKSAPAYDPVNYEQERNCLAQGVYFEARGESREGQLAVAEVILNRVSSGLYPSSVCGVVYQGAGSKNCQFSFACDGAADRPKNPNAWSRATRIAEQALKNGDNDPLVGRATSYHADYVNPAWSRKMQEVTRIGRHVFYEKPKRS
ncbi:MAG: cell wall hydrolase [Parvibaculaceae bacterium]|nr:cell wall hydrolase [Parvibaculaceae bacterium]